MSFPDQIFGELPDTNLLNRPEARVLGSDQERELLLEIFNCKTILAEGFWNLRSEVEGISRYDLDIQDIVRRLLEDLMIQGSDAEYLRQQAIRYRELRTRLAMANLRLVSHVAKRYRNRGIAFSDLIQEGFCGLLTAIDRFDPANPTRLASYAVWWIRQAIQRAVASGAYPVRLNPRHLRQLAASHVEPDRPGSAPSFSDPSLSATVARIYSATQPALSLSAPHRGEEGLCLMDTLKAPATEDDDQFDLDEYVERMFKYLKPREQLVLKLRFGLSGMESHSLSEVSRLLDVSKERIRQIQERAIQKLRGLAETRSFCGAI